MFCIICGKETENTDGICDDCRAGATVREPLYTNRYGFGAALASMLMGSLSLFLFSSFAVFMFIYYLIMLGRYEDEQVMLMTIAFLSAYIMFIAAAVVALVLGIISLRRYVKAKKAGVNPSKTRVLGILGIVFSSILIFENLIGIIREFI